MALQAILDTSSTRHAEEIAGTLVMKGHQMFPTWAEQLQRLTDWMRLLNTEAAGSATATWYTFAALHLKPWPTWLASIYRFLLALGWQWTSPFLIRAAGGEEVCLQCVPTVAHVVAQVHATDPPCPVQALTTALRQKPALSMRPALLYCIKHVMPGVTIAGVR